MKRKLIAAVLCSLALGLLAVAVGLFAPHNTVRAQTEPAQPENNNHSQRPRCSNRTASGTYGYRMNGAIVGLGSFLVNGYFVHNPDGTMRVRAYGAINGQSDLIEATGTFSTNDDCTGTGRFPTPALGVITYYFVLTDNGDQIDLINTNQGIALQGTGRRIAPAGRAPRCDSRLIAGHYSHRLGGSAPGLANVALAGSFTQTPTDRENGEMRGADMISLNGQILLRTLRGTFQINRDCTGTGSYEALGNTINYVFMVVDGGKHLFLQGSDPGVNIAGLATRTR